MDGCASGSQVVQEDIPKVGLIEQSVKPLDGGWGWVVCFACFIGNLTNKIMVIIKY